MKIRYNWQRIACEKCNAVIGQNCFSPPGKFGTVCFERRQAADKLLGIKMPGSRSVVTKDSLKPTSTKA